MPGRLIRTRRARQDLVDIWRYIAQDNPAAADGLLDRIDAACQALLNFPELGSLRDDIRPGLRYRVVGSYLILYRIVANDIEIVRVLHGNRDLKRLT
jgi:toxin ParE1/3/4